MLCVVHSRELKWPKGKGTVSRIVAISSAVRSFCSERLCKEACFASWDHTGSVTGSPAHETKLEMEGVAFKKFSNPSVVILPRG